MVSFCKNTIRYRITNCAGKCIPSICTVILIGCSILVAARVEAERCDQPISICASGGCDSIDNIPYPIVDKILVLSDVHVCTVCPISDIGMWARRWAAQYVHRTRNTIVLGDVHTFGGGSNGANVTKFWYKRQINRFRRITGCNRLSTSNAPGMKSKCVVLPGNHDLVSDPTKRWLKQFKYQDTYGTFDSGVSYYAINAQNPIQTNIHNATLFLSHKPYFVRQGGVALVDSDAHLATLLTNHSFQLALSGDEHLFSVGMTDFNVTEVIVPSFNPVRAYLTSIEEGCHDRPNCQLGLGFAILTVHSNQLIQVTYCHPHSNPYTLHIILIIIALIYSKLTKQFISNSMFMIGILLIMYTCLLLL